MSDFLGMQRAVLRSTRPTTEKIVLLAIIDHWSEASQEPWPSVPTLATLSSLGRTAVLEALAALERDGVIAVRRVAGRPNRYDLSRVSVVLAVVPVEPVRQADRSTALPADDAHTKAADPVRDADRSGPQTSPFGGRDQSAWRTRRIPRSNQCRARARRRAARSRARPADRRTRQARARKRARGSAAATAAMARDAENRGSLWSSCWQRAPVVGNRA